jgi:hypothetical protein
MCICVFDINITIGVMLCFVLLACKSVMQIKTIMCIKSITQCLLNCFNCRYEYAHLFTICSHDMNTNNTFNVTTLMYIPQPEILSEFKAVFSGLNMCYNR